MSPVRGVAVVALGLAIAGLATFADRDAIAFAVVPTLARDGLVELDRLAGLRDSAGAVASATPLSVAVEIDGPAWANTAVADAVANDDAYAIRGGPHRIGGELVVAPSALALRLSLERRGWRLHASPLRRRLQPALAIVPALVGLAIWAFARRIALGLLCAGAIAQPVLALAAWPADLVQRSRADELAEGPIGAWVLALAERMDDTAVALAAGILALTAVLALFDHRRSRGRGGRLLVAGVVGLIGSVAWIEAAGRASVGAWLGTWGGALALFLAAALVWIAGSTRVAARAETG